MPFHIRKARTVSPPPQGAQVYIYTPPDPKVQAMREEQMAHMPLDIAIERVRREIAKLRVSIQAAEGLPDARKLESLDIETRAASEAALNTFQLFQRKYQGGNCGYHELTTAQGKYNDASAKRRVVLEQKRLRTTASLAQTELSAILHTLA